MFPCARVVVAVLLAAASQLQAQRPLPSWTRGATCYEVFIRSFKDSNGDGIGDLNGLIEKLDYIKGRWALRSLIDSTHANPLTVMADGRVTGFAPVHVLAPETAYIFDLSGVPSHRAHTTGTLRGQMPVHRVARQR